MKRLLLLLNILCISLGLKAQTDDWKARYPFLNLDTNVIGNAPALKHFFQQLERLEKGEIKQVRIVHIGDSHLQADYFTGEMRTLLQQQFGNAGRGFVFPYKVANTNGPEDYRSGGWGAWESKRVVFPNKPLPIGLGGITLSTGDTNALLFLRLKEEEKERYAFDQVTVFRQPGHQYFDLVLGTEIPDNKGAARISSGKKYHTVKSGESLGLIARKYGTSVKQLQQWNGLRGTNIRAGQKLVVGESYVPAPVNTETLFNDLYCIPANDDQYTVTCRLPEPGTSMYLRHMSTSPEQNSGLIYGISLENTQKSGILYHTIGVNGAQYMHYCLADYFTHQVEALQPDLIIFSLGTNEAFARDLGEEQLYSYIDTLISRLSEKNPESSLLICTQPDTYLRKKYKNPRNIMIQGVLSTYSQDRYTGLWDLNSVMGGYGSIYHWYKSGLTAGDKVHFSVAGYRLQGQLLYKALMDSYAIHRTN